MDEIKKINLIALVICVCIAGVLGYFTVSKYSEAREIKKTQHFVLTSVEIQTNMGTFVVGLYDETMPVTTENFKTLVKEGFYDGVTFHRIVPDFVIQGGDPQGTGMGGSGTVIEDEFTDNNQNLRGTISMANSGPNTGTSQFFINLKDNHELDYKHPVFGEVISGMEVVDEISKVDTGDDEKPERDVKIISATIIE